MTRLIVIDVTDNIHDAVNKASNEIHSEYNRNLKLAKEYLANEPSMKSLGTYQILDMLTDVKDLANTCDNGWDVPLKIENETYTFEFNRSERIGNTFIVFTEQYGPYNLVDAKRALIEVKYELPFSERTLSKIKRLH